MTGAEPLLDRRAIEDAFRRLGERLIRRGVIGDVYVFGGAAMALAYDARRATRDIDAVFKPHGIVLEEARAVADELGLPGWWLMSRRAATSHPMAIRRRRACSTIRGFVWRRHRRNTFWR